MNRNLPFDVHQPSPLLWGFSLDELTKILVPVMIAAGVVSTFCFAAIGIFARRWRTGFAVLGAGLIFEALPIVALGLRTGGTFTEVVLGVVKIWSDLIPFLLIFFGFTAWLVRSLWDDLGKTFELALDRWGPRGPILMGACALILYVVLDIGFLLIRHA